MRTLFTLVFAFFIILPFCNSQELELSVKEKNAIDILKVTMFTQNIHGPVYLDHHSYNYERDEEGNLLIFPKNTLRKNNQLMGDKYYNYKITNRNDVPSLIELNHECERYAFIRLDKWDGDKVINTGSRGLNDGKIMYNTEGKISGIDLGQSYQRSGKHKVYSNKLIKVKYNEEGRLVELSKDVLVHKKSSSSKNLKKDYTFQEYLVKVNYGDQLTTLTMDKFRAKDKKTIKTSNVVYKLNKNDWYTVNEKISTTHNKKGTKEHKTTEKMEYNEEMNLIKMTVESQYRKSTTDYVYDQGKNIINEIFKSTNKNNQVKEEITTRKFDSNGLLEEEKKIKKKDGQLTETIVTKYTYTPIKEGVEITKCKHKKEGFVSFYNSEGELYKESAKNKVRVKENGTWGEWKHYTM